MDYFDTPLEDLSKASYEENEQLCQQIIELDERVHRMVQVGNEILACEASELPSQPVVNPIESLTTNTLRSDKDLFVTPEGS